MNDEEEKFRAGERREVDALADIFVCLDCAAASPGRTLQPGSSVVTDFLTSSDLLGLSSNLQHLLTDPSSDSNRLCRPAGYTLWQVTQAG